MIRWSSLKYRFGLWIGVWLLMSSPFAVGMTHEIAAVFRPDLTKPMDGKFTVTTPNAGYCLSYPSDCAGSNTYSMRLPLIVESSRPIEGGHAAPDGAYFWVAPEWRKTQVVNSATGEVEEVEMRLTGFGSEYVLDRSVVELVGGGVSAYKAHEMLWETGRWDNMPLPDCSNGSLVDSGTDTTFAFFWKSDGECYKKARFRIPYLKYRYFDIAYQVRMPNPFKMSNGRYTGTLSYPLSPSGGAFDVIHFGRVMMPNDSTLDINFTLDVEHNLKVDIPPGGHRIALEPAEGWQAWLNRGQKPTRLFRDQTFHLWTTSRFKMSLECEHILSKGCALRAPETGWSVPVQVSVTLPNGVTDATGQAVNRHKVPPYAWNAEVFQAGSYIDGKPGTLHFEILPADVEQMLKYGDNRRYWGDITVVWDSEV